MTEADRVYQAFADNSAPLFDALAKRAFAGRFCSHEALCPAIAAWRVPDLKAGVWQNIGLFVAALDNMAERLYDDADRARNLRIRTCLTTARAFVACKMLLANAGETRVTHFLLFTSTPRVVPGEVCVEWLYREWPRHMVEQEDNVPDGPLYWRIKSYAANAANAHGPTDKKVCLLTMADAAAVVARIRSRSWRFCATFDVDDAPQTPRPDDKALDACHLLFANQRIAYYDVVHLNCIDPGDLAVRFATALHMRRHRLWLSAADAYFGVRKRGEKAAFASVCCALAALRLPYCLLEQVADFCLEDNSLRQYTRDTIAMAVHRRALTLNIAV
jgi:hypothetical protein